MVDANSPLADSSITVQDLETHTPKRQRQVNQVRWAAKNVGKKVPKTSRRG